ncbi:MAG TPA: MarR family transcriptional regulator [Tenuifilaceae bacterium]|nr:MarR family transcriptional regulator [Tenuifilaceae bacterium]HPI44534.1 MarR family transcriptional regulator [Tenuifilaceae bacterium]HPN22342.1 MarR family transcriptional regulator [Tenuifilaceae bacterium]HSA04113.1 MarR family transcriptional regulator [Tenuifilaceae bacterium]
MKIDDEIKGRFRNEYHRGIINLTYTLSQLNYQFLQLLKKHNVTQQQYNVLKVLRGFRSEAPVSIGFIKDRMLDKNSDVSRIVDKLYERGLVTRCEKSTDRRQKDVDISDKGLELLAAMDECEKKVDTLLSNLTEDEVKQLNNLLDKIRG